ncbi:BREX-2 system adenine-specific DNA-methyltransferase PglX [Promicromonospora soli]|uniref:site-specific DNA-methyltransferase (adenine-specific) n=1 Tax=Promicromonospora soli TaxID=2035533 RepID=A0A919G8C7_9MICO|nr:BREX-2 system adenine-specific DNA-methyltransferase PglX [Promicromonospora soli]GHH79140.1 DNA methylase [Promicromonospora soli]
MINSPALLKDLQGQLKRLQADLRERADDADNVWGKELRSEHSEAVRTDRTARSWVAWRDDEVDQAAVAWLIATTFVRFCEDNDLLAGATLNGTQVPVGWIAGPGDRTQRAQENLDAYFRANPLHNRRHWLQQSFTVLAAQPAGASLVDRRHNPVWSAEISPEAGSELIAFWRRTDDAGNLVHDFTDPDLGTRFLGDLYQDLSDHAKKTYALLQTPEFVEEFILDRTLTPALRETALEDLKLIDPTCGSGHFLLGAFGRIDAAWREQAPAMDAKERVRMVLNSIHGVDVNPFAVAIARFRLTVVGLLAMGEKSLVGVPALGFHLAIGDSLLGEQGRQGTADELLFGQLDMGDTLGSTVEPVDTPYRKHTEDLSEYSGILTPGQYHVVVGNPPYITVKDKALNAAYRAAYSTTSGKYALSVPFMELFFRLAMRGEQGQAAGHVGQITSNSFMKREFGKKVIEELFAGYHGDNPVDLTEVIDTSGAYIPGHGTPTVILVGRRRRPVTASVRAVLGVRGEPGQPVDPAKGLVWTEIVGHLGEAGYDGNYISVADLDRATLTKFPWSLSGGGAADVFEAMRTVQIGSLRERLAMEIGFASFPGNDEPFFLGLPWFKRFPDSRNLGRDLVVGEVVRDWDVRPDEYALAPYGPDYRPLPYESSKSWGRHLWRFRTTLGGTTGFGGQTRAESGEDWWTWYRWVRERYLTSLSITFAEVATHNHFVLDRGGKVFKQTAPVITLPESAPEERHLELLAVLNSSTACFWLKQVSHDKGSQSGTGGFMQDEWEVFYQFNSTKVSQFPLPATLPLERGRRLDALATELAMVSPGVVVQEWVDGVSTGSTTGSDSLAERLAAAAYSVGAIRGQMVREQEELDWEVYRLYGLIDEDLTAPTGDVPLLALGERAFEIALARHVADGSEETVWFERHGSQPLTELSVSWPGGYADVVQRRLDLIESDKTIRLLEKPEYKRRWARTPWAKQQDEAVRSAILDRLEGPELWQDAQGPVTRTVQDLADALRDDVVLRELVSVLSGHAEPNLATVLSGLVAEQAVPYLAAQRYKPSGLEKFRTWQQVWDLQRREDAGEKVTIPVPPKYSTPDFRKVEYWKARGKLDVPKERFVAYPDVRHDGDPTVLLGWAGWPHRDQALALAREILAQQSRGASDEAVVPLVAGLVELEPWVAQWHSEIEPAFGTSAAAVVSGTIDQHLARLEMTRDQVTAWTPEPVRRMKR